MREHRVALVTGVSRAAGIGAALARRLAADGFALVLSGWTPADEEQPWGGDPAGLRRLLEELQATGAALTHLPVDLADPDAPQRLVGAAVERFGRLDVLVADHARSSSQSLEEVTAAEVDLTYAVNVRATLLLVQAMAGAYGGGPGGRVVLFTSGQHHGGMPGELPYVASKAALHGLTKSLAVGLAPRGITVNCVDPGPTDTGYADPSTHRWVAGRVPLGRWGRPEDTARLVSWLASRESDWVTGQVVAADGGWSAV